MKIALYTGSALPKVGGQELVVDALARQFAALGHQPTVIAPMPRRPLRPDDASLPYPVIRHPRFYSTKFLVRWYRMFLLKAQRENHFDIIHCHDVYPTGYLAGLCKAQLRAPVVITSHGGDVKEGNVRLRKRGMERRFVQALRQADALVSIGRFTEEGFKRLCPTAGPIRTIPNGVDLLPFARPAARPADLDPAIVSGEFFLFLGRLKDRKGVSVILEALALLPARDSVELVVAGEGEERQNLAAQITRLNLQKRVRLIGRVMGDAKIWLLQNARAVVMPSRVWEAFPLVVLESYAAGKPVIASDIPGLRDLVQADQTGYLIPEGAPSPLAEALRKLMDDPALTQRLGDNAARIAQAYAWPEIARRHVDLYLSMIKDFPRSK